jgi:hypothetical protein
MKFSIFAAVAIALCTPAFAQSGAKSDSAALSAARDYLVSTGFEQQMEQGALQNVKATYNTMVAAREKQTGQPMPQDLKAKVLNLLQAETADVVADMKKTALNEAALIYARYFTAAELKELQALQTHPVMAKVHRVAPSMTSELMQIGIRASEARQPQLQAKIQKLVDDWQQKRR